MGLERLTRREAAAVIRWGTVTQVDAGHDRVKVSMGNGLEPWAACAASDFPDLAAGQTVAVGYSEGSYFIVRTAAAVRPSDYSLLVV